MKKWNWGKSSKRRKNLIPGISFTHWFSKKIAIFLAIKEVNGCLQHQLHSWLQNRKIPTSQIRPKKKTSLFPVAGLKIAMRNAVFYFFFTIHEKAMRNAIFIFLNKTSGRKYIKTIIALVSFLTFNKNITSFIWFMWPLFYMHSAHLYWIFFHGLKLHHILYIKF